jgi:hypothetical protein
MKYKNVIFFLLVIIKRINKGKKLNKVKHTGLNSSHFKIKLIIIILLFENQSILSFQINTRRPFLSYILIRSTIKMDVLSTLYSAYNMLDPVTFYTFKDYKITKA